MLQVYRKQCSKHSYSFIAAMRGVHMRSQLHSTLASLAQEAAAARLAEMNRQREIRRRMQPRTADDFATLYNELEAWRVTETRRVKSSGMSVEEKQHALQVLLHKVMEPCK